MDEPLDIFDQIKRIPFIAPPLATKLIKLVNGDRIIDLLLHIPIAFINKKTIKEGKVGDTVFGNVQILKHAILKNNNISIHCIADDEIPLEFIFFNSFSNYPFRHFPIGTKHYIKGRLFKYRSIAHPEKIVPQDEYPVYSLTYGISQLVIFNLLKKVLNNIANIKDWSNNDSFPKFIDAIKILHATDRENEKKKLYCA